LHMAVKFDGCGAYIYDEAGTLLLKTTVVDHDTVNSIIEIEEAPEIADRGKYDVLILTAPSPHTFSCIAEVKLDRIDLKLFRGERKEQRNNVRYVVNGQVEVTGYIHDNKVFPLHTPQEAILVNLSKGGVRLRMKLNSLSLDDMVQIKIQVGDKPKVLSAHVVNTLDTEDSSEYGCKLIDYTD